MRIDHHRRHAGSSELATFAEFYLVAGAVSGLLYLLVTRLVPLGSFAGRPLFLGLASFLVGCGLTAWVFESYRKHHRHH